ncbi:MAG TPA: hypothetical protein V6D09_05095 [Leptolyngbyaceae cyanobacterium]
MHQIKEQQPVHQVDRLMLSKRVFGRISQLLALASDFSRCLSEKKVLP